MMTKIKDKRQVTNKTKYLTFSIQKRRTKKMFKFKMTSKFNFDFCIWNLKMPSSNNAYKASGG